MAGFFSKLPYMRYSICLFIVAMLLSCENESHDVDYFDMPYQGESEISLDEISLEKVALDSLNTSFIGDFYVNDSGIYYVDERFCTVNKFNIDGSFIETMVGLGKGPNETMIGRVEGFDNSEKYNILIGPSRDFHAFDPDWRSIIHRTIKSHPRDHIPVNNTPPTDDPGLYSLDYFNMDIENFNEKLFISVSTDHPYCHPFLPLYYEECPIIVQVDFWSGTWEEMFGRRSPKYRNYNGLGQFSFFTFALDDKGRFYVGFEIDPKVYVYDRGLSPLHSYGMEGQDIDTTYTDISIRGNIHGPDNLRRVRDIPEPDRSTKGYYKTLKLFDDMQMLFRTHSKNQQSDNDGLQIYKKEVLIGDVPVPKSFEVVGYSAPYFYGQINGNGDAELLQLYRFKI